MYKEKFQITYIKPRMDVKTAFFSRQINRTCVS